MNGDDKRAVDKNLQLKDLDSESIELLETMQTDAAKTASDALFSEDIDFSSTYEPGATETKLP